VLVLVPAQPRTHGHGRSQVQSGGLGSSNGTCFGEDVVSFIETRVDVRGRAGDMVLTDERLITFVCISLINGFIEIVKLLLERDADIQCDEASMA
jgi:hypothetical protein